MGMHTWVRKEDKPYEEMLRAACQRLRYLRKKLLDDLAAAEKIFVFKMGDRLCTTEEVERLHLALRRHGNNTLLHVRRADSENRPGTVVHVKEGLLVGYIAHFNTYADGNARPVALDDWRSICRSALELREKGFADQGSPDT